MPKHKTVYNKSWENSHPYLKPGPDKWTARCTICTTDFKVDISGVAQVVSHARGVKHQAKERLLKGGSQTTLISSSEGQVTLSKGKLILSLEDILIKAETLQALCLFPVTTPLPVHQTIMRDSGRCFRTRKFLK